jgi:CBS domain-containing protein
MKEHDIGDVLVADDGQRLCGLVTDRDIVIRGLAEGREAARLGDICTQNLIGVRPDDDVETAVRVMGKYAVRRLPVVEDGTAVGMVSLGDLAIELDPDTALADISSAPADD